MDELPIMSRSEYARARGISSTQVTRLVRKGRLVLDERGRVIVAASDALREKLRDPTRGGVGGSPVTAAERAPFPAGATLGAQTAASMSLTDAARAEKIERWRLLQLEVAERAGRLVRRDVVDAETFRRARQAQELLMSLRERLVPLLAVETDERAIDLLLDQEFRQVLKILASPASDESREAA